MSSEKEILEKCAEKLRRNGFDTLLVSDAGAAGEFIKERIARMQPDSISFGDSLTLYATGVVDWLRSGKEYPFIDTFEKGVRFRELIERRRQALLCELFMTGVNAITMTGELHWLDMIGNRVAPIAFGPRSVIIVAGRNKIVQNGEAAFRRIREIAAPRNAARHEGFTTPCVITGVCMDCASPQRICNERLVIHKCHPRGRITVVLIDEDMGL